jgi:hypothetical protein
MDSPAKAKEHGAIHPLGRDWCLIPCCFVLTLLNPAAGQMEGPMSHEHKDKQGEYEAAELPTAEGSVECQICTRCFSTRVMRPDGTVKELVRTETSPGCDHSWAPGIGAWSSSKLTKGDVLLIRRSERYNAVKILESPRPGSATRFEWWHQPDADIGTFADPGVLRGQAEASREIRFEDVSIPWSPDGRIWYDFYYGGIAPSSQNRANPHFVAFAGNGDVAEVNAADPGWIYKCWEDGEPNGYSENLAKTREALSKDDLEALRTAWSFLSPSIKPSSNAELIRLHEILTTSYSIYVEDAEGRPWPRPIWPSLKEDIESGGAPGESSVWADLVGSRIGIASTRRLCRVLGLIVPARRLLGRGANILVQTEKGAAQVSVGDIDTLRLGQFMAGWRTSDGNPLMEKALPVYIRTSSGALVEGYVDCTYPALSGLDFILHPLTPFPVGQEVSSGFILTPDTSRSAGIPLVDYDWICFIETGIRACPRCARPADTMEWTHCPYDGTPYEQTRLDVGRGTTK